MKTNLLLLDTLRNAENLISTGFSLSAQLNRKLKIVYVLDFTWVGNDEYMGATAPNIDSTIRIAEAEIRREYENASSEIRKITAKYLQHNSQIIPFEIDISETSRLLLIDQVVEDEKDVLVLTSNYNSYSVFLSDAVSYPNVIDRTPCPVFIIPDNIQTISVDNWLYTTAFHPEDLTAISHLSDLFGRNSGKKLTVFHNSKPDDFDARLKWEGFQSQVREVAVGFDLNFALSYEKDVREGLRIFIENNNPDLIVILKEKKGFFRDIFSSSETHYVVTHFDKPVLIYHEENLS